MDVPERPIACRRWCLLAVLAWTLFASQSSAQIQEAQVYYTRQPEIRIPVSRDTTGRLKQVQLYVSTDQGRDWRLAQSTTPDTGFFPSYFAPNDGTYWFAVRAIDFGDRANPAAISQLTPQLKIVLDRRPPTVTLKQISDSRPGIVTVDWDVRDENFDPRRFALEYRVGSGDWQREPAAEPKPNGVQSWKLESGVRMEVRLRVADKAGNDADHSIPVGFTPDGRPLDPPNRGGSDGHGGSSSGGHSGIVYSKSTRISLGYKFERMPVSGVPVFELWYTKDKGQHWTKAPKAGDATAGSNDAMPATPGSGSTESAIGKLIFDADSQGLYGFVTVARNGVGIGDPDPKPGDPAKFWVMVDTEAPHVTVKVQRGQGYDVRNVRIEWSADDPNLTDRPVTIEYADIKGESPPGDGDWKPIPADGLSGRLDRSGVQVWSVGRNGPYKFLIRVKAEDKAGNVGVEQWRDPIVVDLEHPNVNITGIEPAGAAPTGGRLP